MAVFTGLGSQASPSITFSANTNTGIFSPGANQVSISTSGVERLNVNAGGEVTTTNEKINFITVGRGGGNNASNTAIGQGALFNNTTGCLNTAVGSGALGSNTTGIENTAVGSTVLNSNTTGNCNTVIGRFSLVCNTSGSNNISVGRDNLTVSCTATRNVAVGNSALSCNTTGSCNIAVGGLNTLRSNTTGGCNVAVGDTSLCSNTTGSENTAVGAGALANSTGGCNTAIGSTALSANSTGANNIAVGVNAGITGLVPDGIAFITTESNRIVMGNFDHTCAQIKIAWTVTSDCRDKTCFAPVPHGLDFVRALVPTEYRFKEGSRDSEIAEEKRRYGFLAQDILPLEGDDPVIISTDDPDKLQYTEAYLIPVLVKAIQELAQEVNELKNA
jgi:hypothetical protein